MISFSTQRFSSFFRSTAAFICGLAIFTLLNSTAHAQSNDALFRGTWQIDTPDNGALILIVKSQGRASYFWGDNTDRTVYQGTWTSSDESATLTWSDGSQHRIQRDNLGFGITHLDTNGSERYTSQAQQVPAEILGQWAKKPSKSDDAVSNRDKAKGFFGIWMIDDENGNTQYIFVESDRSAASTSGANDGLRGSWAKQGSELHIAWDSGHYSIIRENAREFAYKQVEPGRIIEDDETELVPASRVVEDSVPSAWLAKYRQEREVHTGGIAFSSRKNARAFYRGEWLIKLSDTDFERVEIARFGGLTTSKDSSLEGDWRMSGQDIFMRWDDGMRKILSPIGRGFVIYEYKPGRPLDGVPTRIRAAVPADSTKLAEHMKGREDVAQQMIALAEAAGIDPIEQEKSGWGRTFARWAWPFGEDEKKTADTPEAILREEYEEPRETDPWWWPFWSEKPEQLDEAEATESTELPEAETVVEETTEAVQTIELDTPTSKEDAEESTEKKRSVKDWVWPF